MSGLELGTALTAARVVPTGAAPIAPPPVDMRDYLLAEDGTRLETESGIPLEAD